MNKKLMGIGLFKTKEAKMLWKNADDGIIRTVLLKEIYNNVPKDIANVYIHIMELHTILGEEEKRKKVLKWLSEEEK